VEFHHRKDWKRLAVVSEHDWIAKAMELFAWAMPGDLRVFDLGELDDAKAWTAAG
jgi:SpoIIAA-like